MKILTARIGLWASIVESACCVVYVIGLVIVLAALFSTRSAAEVAATKWTGIQEYAAHYADNPLAMNASIVVQISAFVSALAVLVVMLALHDLADPSRRILASISAAFALALTVTSSMMYYIQVASIHQVMLHGGDLEGLAQFAESNTTSPAMATLQLGWAFFYGLVTLFAAFLFTGKGVERWIRVAFLTNGVIGVAVGILYAFGVTWILPLSILSLIVSGSAYPLIAVRFFRMQFSPVNETPPTLEMGGA